MACHHLLWIFLGVMTEPFWGLEPSSDQKRDVIIMSCILSFAVLSLFVLLLLVFFAVAQIVLSESLIATLVLNALKFVVTA